MEKRSAVLTVGRSESLWAVLSEMNLVVWWVGSLGRESVGYSVPCWVVRMVGQRELRWEPQKAVLSAASLGVQSVETRAGMSGGRMAALKEKPSVGRRVC
jgi:hypothetical protein